MRRFLISALVLTLAAGCSSVKLGPHRIDVQQGNALDQENVARLKPGLSRSQVRFLLGTPLLVDPFRTNRWDYVYLYNKAGKLTEQKRITLYFEGDTLARIEGDVPAADAVVPAQPDGAPAAATATPMPAPTTASQPAPLVAPPSAAPAAVTPPAEPAAEQAVEPAQSAQPPAPRAAVQPAPQPEPAAAPTPGSSSIVAPLPSPKNAPPYVDPRPASALTLQTETDVTKIQPEGEPPVAATEASAATIDAAVLQALNEWADAWSRRDAAAHFAAYDADFVPEGGGSRATWEARKRQVMAAAKRIEVEIASPAIDRADDGTATVTFNQFYRSDRYRDAVVKQVRMAERDGRWLIVEERVLSTLPGLQP